MDFIRSAIKALFYRFPVGKAAQCILHAEENGFVEGMREVLRWDNQQYSSTEIRVLSDVICQTWMNPIRENESVESISVIGRSLYVPFHLGVDLFDESSWERPLLQYEQLLRWRDIVFYVGEDLFSTSFLAGQDSSRMYNRTFFSWENVIRHNNKTLNKLLDSGLSEVHTHINAATDVFELNWLRLMNDAGQDYQKPNSDKERKAALTTYRQEYTPSLWDDEIHHSLPEWGIIASAIRVAMFKTVSHGIVFTHADELVLKKMMIDNVALYDRKKELQSEIGALGEEAFLMPMEKPFDYAITKQSVAKCGDDTIIQPYFVHHGEREMLYRFFRMIYEQPSTVASLMPYVYLYLLIKSAYRREFIQTNPLNGFENFKRYQDRKALFLKEADINNRVNFRYAIQTSLRDLENEKLEARMAPEQVEKRLGRDYKQSIFLEHPFYQHEVREDDLTYVVHFMKRPDISKADNVCRHAAIRSDIQKQMENVIHLCQTNLHDMTSRPIHITGIDAAGSELDCRPEVFAPSFRYAQLCGLSNITYHAGEDFYDLIDGLRTIDEAIVFLNYQRGCRIGHAIALGLNPRSYYTQRHRNVIMPKQVFLDNLVWLYYKSRQYNNELHPATLDMIDKMTHRLYQEIGYEGSFDRYEYWQSMLLRGDAPDEITYDSYAIHERAALCKHPLCNDARKSTRAKVLWQQYHRSGKVKEKGSQPVSYVLPNSIDADIESLQDKIMDEVEKRGICIECNPFSNQHIGPFKRYDEHPIWRFHNVRAPLRHSINVSVNTDDKGIFATSLYNEFSLLSLAMLKKKTPEGEPEWTTNEVITYIKELIEMGHFQKFDVKKVWVGESI